MSALNPNMIDAFKMWANPKAYIKEEENKSAHTVWAKKVYKKFDYTCFRCGYKAGGDMAIEAHHIYHREYYPRMAYRVDNGVCLCFECHRGSNGYSYHSMNLKTKGGEKVFKRWLYLSKRSKKQGVYDNLKNFGLMIVGMGAIFIAWVLIFKGIR